ncbi:hypothetical protein M409DRAFT_24353 [Zasmidium cellare ATCC 36951]|uniref:Enoyl reductase (ER) domain-containing protein n=1 Tax=Zasmidium cellare ATCC 36951 TaxID=1080233 RepID=A0A6A6CEK6_ZASCE|nr:uncharacterized protein M409DRAFT_24353 [Zasmidium cellare ATCC 36951]KAF2165501.1 hypothetical protein M409DRAFT_24353 [Zasmidium cellare ATCC 36951]
MSNQAAWIDGKAQKLRVASADLPKPGPDDVVIKNHAVAINPVDWKIQDYGVFVQSWPTILGEDIAGEVYELGANVSKFKKGDRVVAHQLSLVTGKPEDGGFQLYARAAAVFTAKIPDSLSYTQASVLPLALDTAGHGLYDSREKGFIGLDYPSLTPKPSGKTILVWGGSSSVGALAIQLATASGAKVISVASKHNLDFLKSLGAVEALDYNTPSIVDDAVTAIKSAGGDFAGIYDAISTEASYKFVLPIAEKLGGTHVAVTLPAPKELPSGVTAANVFAVNKDVNGRLWEEYVTPALEQGKLKAVPEAFVVGKGLEYVQKGFDTNKAGVSAKKVVVEL